jgi:hypothetical protein
VNNVQQEKVYDLAKDHFMGNFPPSLPIEKAYLHIGTYLGWIVDHGLYSEFFEEEAATEIFRFRRREIAPTVLSEIWDGRLSHELFSQKGNLFTYYYYAGGIYKKDYARILADTTPSLYHVEDTWENYGKISQRISDRFADWEKIIE